MLRGNAPLALGWCAVPERILEELDCLFVLEHVPLVQVLKHVTVPLDQDFRVLLAVAELLVAISLDALQEIRHEGRLLLEKLLLDALVLLHVLLLFGELLEFFQLVAEVLEVRSTVVILRREVLLLEGPVLRQLLRANVLERRVLETVA